MGANPVFVDANVLVYLFDADSPDMQLRAQKLLHEEQERIVVSVQVLGEFYVTVTRRLTVPLASEVAMQAIDEFCRFQVHALHPELMHSAIRRNQSSKLSYWDSLVVETALSAGAEILYAEDLQHEQEISRLRIVNPLAHSTSVKTQSFQQCRLNFVAPAPNIQIFSAGVSRQTPCQTIV